MSKLKETVKGFGDLFKKGDKNSEEPYRNDLEEYKRKREREKTRRYVKAALIAMVILLTAVVVKTVIDQRTYDSYKVVEMNEQLDSSVLHYKELGNYVLRYSGDGVTLLNQADKVVWNDSIQMTSPVIVSFDKVAALYETKGTKVHIYGIDGKKGTIDTEYPILKVAISAIGSVAMVLENGENTLINYYAADGSLIASSSTNMKNPGYPVDVAISEDGMGMAVSHFVADSDEISSYLAFYNFGDAGKNKEDNLLDGARFEGILLPKVQYLDDKTLIAYREDGFSVYRGTSILNEIKNVTFEEEIVSSFSDGNLFGFVFSGADDEHAFQMKVYNASGNLQMECGFDLVYDQIKISGNQIILFNTSQLAVIGSNGVERYSGNFEEGNILDVVKRGMNRYAVACNKGIVLIELT